MKSLNSVFLSIKLIIVFLLRSSSVFSQDCESSVIIILKNNDGNFFKGQVVKITAKAGGIEYKATSNEKGEVNFTLPCNTIYNVTASNYSSKEELELPEYSISNLKLTLTYSADMKEKEKLFSMNAAQQASVNATAALLPDTTFVTNSKMLPPKTNEHFSTTTISIQDIEGNPLSNETICLTGIKRGKNIKAKTNTEGELFIFLPKGDTYAINFKHHKNFISLESPYSIGSSVLELSFNYLGTLEIERRKKLEEERIKVEEKRLKEEEDAFITYCKKLHITPEEGRKRKIIDRIKNYSGFSDTVITSVFNRNKWNDKLIVCDVTGSMDPYAAQLSLWYQLNYQKEKNLQFVFFNDGDNKPDAEKKIGDTKGIYYSTAKGVDSLLKFMSKVSAAGSGGDCPENNMEALIKGTTMAHSYKELVMIADNNAPVKDIQLLKDFNKPVHIILCGVNDWVMADYLLIAWKTKGSIHTLNEDIVKIANLMEGQNITINKITYRIMGGEFVRITAL